MLDASCDRRTEHISNRAKERAMRTFETVTVTVICVAVLSVMPASAADDSKVKDATRQVESGAKTTGEGIKETAKGVGSTVVEGAKTAGDKVKEAGRAAEPEAKSAWGSFKDSASSFGHSVKRFFKGLGG
jgi:nucleotide-binding universal stress UspA family protein